MSIVILQDDIVHYEVLGRGKPLVFLHGWVGSWRYWIPSMQSASISYRTYAVDLFGFGDSAKTQRKYSLNEQVQLLDQFLQEMGIARIALIGHGLGAVVAMLFASKYQNKVVDRLMAVSLPLDSNDLNPRLFNTSPGELADWLLNRSNEGEAVRIEAGKTDPQAIQFAYSNLHTLELTSIANRLTTPCLFVYGQNDPTMQENSRGNSNESLRHIHQITFEQSGHFPMLDEPNKFNRLVADFLALSSGISPTSLSIKEEWKRRVR